MSYSADQRQLLQHALWPDGGNGSGSVWAVLDLARDPRIQTTLLESRLEALCLYSGALPHALARVAPHIVELPPGHRLFERLFELGWGRSWGVFMRLADPMALRHHLRKLLKVRDENGRTLLFRWYDPRVLRAYLPTCRDDELRSFFGPVSAMWAEGEGGRSLIEFRLGQRGLQSHSVVLEQPAAEALADADDQD
jgi:hypothetical protein